MVLRTKRQRRAARGVVPQRSYKPPEGPVYAGGIQLTPNQCRKLMEWLDQAHLEISGFKGL